ncbi:MAG: helix-hairpin-helix domain-containing protein [Cyclobacteriaceae bacterium]|nr:helix-hairpin-helix domain-containing protein [Cyclobacteriaceae bacterium]
MNFTRWISNFFGFSRSQSNGFLILVPSLFLIIFSLPVYHWWQSRQSPDFSYEQARLDSLAARWNQTEINNLPDDEQLPITYFPFDPNTATADELQALGFSPCLSRRLVNYREAGGTFKIKADLLKLYGMNSKFFNTISSFILLPDKLEKAETAARTESQLERSEIKFDLNRADTTLLKSIYGIGPKLANRIVNFRESLGGFLKHDQLYEVYGLDSIVINRLTIASFIQPDFYPRTLNLNTATEQQLETHPYISRRMAKAIVTYRFQYGRYQSIDDLYKIITVDDAMLAKLKPYLEFD